MGTAIRPAGIHARPGSTLAGIYAFAMIARREPHTSSGLLGTPEEEAAYRRAVRRYVLPQAERRSIGRYGELLSGRYRRFEGAARRRFLHPLLVDASSITDADLDILLSVGWRQSC